MNGSAGPLMRAEWRKVTTTKVLWVLGGIAVLYSAIQAVMLTLIAGGLLEGIPGQESLLQDPAYISTLLGQTGTASTFVLILGIIAMTGEYRHMTITTTFLAQPHRWRVVVAKMAVYAALGALIALVTLAVVTIAASLALMRFDHAPITAAAIGTALVGALIGLALYAVVGVGLGSFITNQVGAIVTALVWMLLVEALVGIAFPSVSRWLPGGALSSAMDVGLQSDMTGSLAAADRLPAWGGILVLLGYAAIFAALASRTTLRRDIT